MTPPDLSDVEAGAPIAQIAIPASFSDNAQLGQRVYEAKCSACHAENAAGQNGVAPPLVHKTYQPSHLLIWRLSWLRRTVCARITGISGTCRRSRAFRMVR